MGIHVGIEHRTTYRFDRMTAIHPHVLRLRPAPHCRTPILSYSLRVEPDDHFINWQQDPFGNFMARLVFPEPADVLDVTVDLVADLTVINPFDFFVEDSAEFFPFEYEPQLAADLEPYLRPATDDQSELLDQWLTGVEHRDGETRIADFLVGINRRLYGDIEYSIRMEPGVQTPGADPRSGASARAATPAGCSSRRCAGWGSRLGSCPGTSCSSRATSRRSTVPTGRPPTSPTCTPGPRCTCPVPAGSASTRRRVCSPARGTSRWRARRTRRAAAPITGSTGPTEVEFELLERRHPVPRGPPGHAAVHRRAVGDASIELGAAVDERLAAGDVRLTMGGEPTFVSIDDMDGAEWNTTADSAGQARARRRHRLAPA